MTTSSFPVPVLHLIDSLALGGAERVSVNIANHLPSNKFESHICTTRHEGMLISLISPHVQKFSLNRTTRFDITAILRLARYIRKHQIQLIHAHSSTVFIAIAATRFTSVRIIWHVHYGQLAVHPPTLPYKIAAHFVSAGISVSQPLTDWVKNQLGILHSRYIPNFVIVSNAPAPPLPGKPGSRILCVANLRPVKDQVTLIRAMALLKESHPDAYLILVGNHQDTKYKALVEHEIAAHNLEDRVSLLGAHNNPFTIMCACDIGVLSSINEGFPLTLLEYGLAKLPVIATNTGQCGEILNNGEAGILIPSASPKALCQALNTLLESSTQREVLGEQLYQRIQSIYSVEQGIQQIMQVYASALNE